MQLLLPTLDRILRFCQEDRGEFCELLQPGLKIQEVQDYCSTLPFELSEEFYCLYQWRNGTQQTDVFGISLDFFPGYRFLSLIDALKAYELIDDFRKTYTTIEKPCFPIFGSQDLGYFVLPCESDKLVSSPIYFLDWNSGDTKFVFQYSDLTSMIMAIAECYEVGAYYLEEEIMDQFGTVVEYLKEDEPKVQRIRNKYS